VTAFYKVFVCPSTWRTFNYKLAIKGEEYTFIWFWFIQNIVFLYYPLDMINIPIVEEPSLIKLTIVGKESNHLSFLLSISFIFDLGH
jgi:hypothetical protein